MLRRKRMIAACGYPRGAAPVTLATFPGIDTLYDNDPATMFSDAGVTPISDGVATQQWNNKLAAGDGRQLTQVTSTKRPVYSANAGSPYVQFDNIDDFMSSSSSSLSWTDGVGKQWFAITLCPDTVTSLDYLLFLSGSPDVASLRLDSGVPKAASMNGAGTLTDDAGSTLTAGVWVTLIAEYTDTSVEVLVDNGSASGPTTLTGTRSTSLARLWLGSNNGAGNFFGGKIRRIAHGKGALSDRATLQTLMAAA